MRCIAGSVRKRNKALDRLQITEGLAKKLCFILQSFYSMFLHRDNLCTYISALHLQAETNSCVTVSLFSNMNFNIFKSMLLNTQDH